jgi:hypothetical protein
MPVCFGALLTTGTINPALLNLGVLSLWTAGDYPQRRES